MNTLPNTTIPYFDFNLPQNFNPLALAKLLISVFPINGEPFYFGNMYPILDKLKDAGVKLQWHRAYNALDGLTGYTIFSGSPDTMYQIAEHWGYTFEQYSCFDPSGFAPEQPQGTAVAPHSSSVAGPSSSNA